MKTYNICNLEKKNFYFTSSKVNLFCRSCRDETRKTYCKKYRKDNKNSILQAKCWALCNLQPLEASENVKKLNRLNYEVR
jgi:hypothetical protein